MSEEFTPITSQEQLDSVLKDRLNRQNEKHNRELEEVKSQFADYEALKTKTTDYETTISDLTAQLTAANEKVLGNDSALAEKDAIIKKYELDSVKNKVASSFGLSSDAIEFLSGNNEEEITASAEKLSRVIPKKVAPLAATGSAASDSRTAALRTMLSDLT